jgi:CRISPR-associated protein Cas6
VSEDDLPPAFMVDLVFPLAGRNLPRDHAQLLRQGLQQAMPWLGDEPLAGVHSVKLIAGNEAQALLSQRARLLLRLPRQRVDAASELAGGTLDLGGCVVRLGVPHLRELQPYATLYAPAVAAPGEEESVFLLDVDRELQALQVRAQRVCGKRARRQLQGRDTTTFSLMLHGLSPQDSLRMQEHGLGPHRLLGCGIFVPHKSAAAVGE